jgi:hypothetical protein
MNISYLKLTFSKPHKFSFLKYQYHVKSFCTKLNTNKQKENNSIEIMNPKSYYPIVKQTGGAQFFHYGIKYLIIYPSLLYLAYKAILTGTFLPVFYNIFLALLLRAHSKNSALMIKQIGIEQQNGKDMLRLTLFNGKTKIYDLPSISKPDPSKLSFKIQPQTAWILVAGDCYIFPNYVNVLDKNMFDALRDGSLKEYIRSNPIKMKAIEKNKL